MKLVAPERYEQLKASGQLPSPGGVALAILRLLQRDDYQLEDLSRLVQSDPVIAGQLLKFANAAIYGHHRPVVSLAKAISTLGAHRVQVLVLGLSLLQSNRSGKCLQFNYARFWSRALATAISAQALAPYAKIPAEENFTAGLLCNIGELALASIFPEQYGAILSVSGNLEERLELERDAFDTDHCELGASLLKDWGLPDVLIAAAYHSENPDTANLPDGSRGFTLTYSLHIALAMADICVAKETERWGLAPYLFAKAARLGIGTEELTTLADGIISGWCEWGEILEIQTHEISSFASLLASSPPIDMDSESPFVAAPIIWSALVICPDSQESSEMASCLATCGYVVKSVTNGMDGLSIALHDNPDLILLEMHAPDIDGLSICQALRGNLPGKGAYIILVGNESDEHTLTKALQVGADDFLLRPITVHALSSKLHTVSKVIRLHKEILKERSGMARSAGEWAGTNRRLLQEATTDALTRLANRRHGLDFLAAEWAAAHANSQPLACLMIDIDHFKRINDKYGHETGDVVLAGVASRLQASARSEDMVFRYGGEEFCVICPNAVQAMARSIAERFRQKVAADHFKHGGMEIPVTVSVGVAAAIPPYASDETLIRDADTALYRAKKAGRNRVSC